MTEANQSTIDRVGIRAIENSRAGTSILITSKTDPEVHFVELDELVGRACSSDEDSPEVHSSQTYAEAIAASD